MDKKEPTKAETDAPKLWVNMSDEERMPIIFAEWQGRPIEEKITGALWAKKKHPIFYLDHAAYRIMDEILEPELVESSCIAWRGRATGVMYESQERGSVMGWRTTYRLDGEVVRDVWEPCDG